MKFVELPSIKKHMRSDGNMASNCWRRELCIMFCMFPKNCFLRWIIIPYKYTNTEVARSMCGRYYDCVSHLTHTNKHRHRERLSCSMFFRRADEENFFPFFLPSPLPRSLALAPLVSFSCITSAQISATASASSSSPDRWQNSLKIYFFAHHTWN